MLTWILSGGGATAPLVAQVCLLVSLAFLLLAWAVAPEVPRDFSDDIKRPLSR